MVLENQVPVRPTEQRRKRKRAPAGPPRTLIVFRLPNDLAALAQEQAKACGLPRNRWIMGIVRNRLTGAPTFSRDAELALIQVRSELRRMRIDLEMMRKIAERSGVVSSADVGASLVLLREELGVHMDAIAAGFVGNLSYWSGKE